MERTYRTVQETIKYFKQLAWDFETMAHRNDDPIARAKAEVYELAAFEIEHNLYPELVNKL